MRVRLPLNCLLVAAWLWGMSRGRSWMSIRRSVSFRGLIPHFGVVREHGPSITMIEYIPRRRKHSKDGDGQCFCLFDGLFRVREFRQTGVGTGDTLREAMAAIIRQ